LGLAGNVERRLAEIGGSTVPVEAPSWERMSSTFKRMGRVAPQSPSEMGKLQRRLVAAGRGGDVAACLRLDTTTLVPVYLPSVDKVVAGRG